MDLEHGTHVSSLHILVLCKHASLRHRLKLLQVSILVRTQCPVSVPRQPFAVPTLTVTHSFFALLLSCLMLDEGWSSTCTSCEDPGWEVQSQLTLSLALFSPLVLFPKTCLDCGLHHLDHSAVACVPSTRHTFGLSFDPDASWDSLPCC